MNGADSITVELVPEVTDDVRILIGELDQILSAEYLPEQRHGLASIRHAPDHRRRGHQKENAPPRPACSASQRRKTEVALPVNSP